MGTPVTMPQTGVSVAEGTLVRWHKRAGERVEADEPLLDISTDKIDTEVPAPASGWVGEVRVGEGDTVEVGTLLATIESEAPAARGVAPPVSPVVARLAAKHAIDLSMLAGSGAGGRVTKRDVLDHVAAAAGRGSHRAVEHRDTEPRDAGSHDGTPVGAGGEGSSRPLSPMRRQIAEHMLRSLRTAAHCTTIVEVDMSGVEAAGGRAYLPWVAHAVAGALVEHPALNATLEDDRLTVHEAVHLGVAVSLGDDGLVVPVVRDAQGLAPDEIAARVKELAARARSGRLTPDEVRGGTFTLTNPGRHGALLATPIINQPQVAILDLEAVVRRPVAVAGDAVAVRPMAYLCLSWDHRALDGEQAARFLGGVRRRVEAAGGRG